MKDEEAQSNHLKNSEYIGRIRARHLNPVMQDSFLHNWKFFRNFQLCKKLSEGCTARGREVCLAAPLAHEVCASTHFFNYYCNKIWKGRLK